MDYSLLKEMLRFLEEYQQENDSNKIEDFIIWLNRRLFSADHQGEHAVHGELLIAFKLMYLNKELKKQTKEVLSTTKVFSIDEYSFLLHLDARESFRKMEIIELHNLNPPTGIEIIKRLLRNKYIEEFADQDDKRAKRIKITRKGIKELSVIKPQIDAIFQEFAASLTLDEKIQINGILNKLIK